MRRDDLVGKRLEVRRPQEVAGVVPVHSESRFGAPMPATRSSRLTVRKSIENRVRSVVFGTVE
jgi:hypothetical protein